MIERTNGASRFNIDTFCEVLGLRGIQKDVGKRDHFVMDALFYFEPVQSTGVICSVLKVGVTARAREFYSS